ncbi:hypothetical protein [Methanobacterium sp. ACI-7]|uniref:hypothetical protein n=1 Tax=unclassified Methanobacterium TaxID=2627676 RepID=UPI0039C01D06
MTDDNLTKIVSKADTILKKHNGVYLERRLYAALKREFSDLSKSNFNSVMNELLEKDYVLERGLIKPQTGEGSKKHTDSKRTGKGTSNTLRIPDKRL